MDTLLRRLTQMQHLQIMIGLFTNSLCWQISKLPIHVNKLHSTSRVRHILSSAIVPAGMPHATSAKIMRRFRHKGEPVDSKEIKGDGSQLCSSERPGILRRHTLPQ